MSFLSYFSLILFHIKMPTDSQTLAPSYALIVTSNRFPSLIIQGFSLLNKSDFLAWYIIYMSSLLISVIYFAKLIALVNSFSDIDGWNSFISKIANLYLFLSGILRKHSITSLVSFHWLILRESLSWWFILSRMFLLIRSISFFAGLIRLALGLFLKFGLWSFNVIKHSFLPFVNIRINISLSFMSFFLSVFILL